MSNEKLSNEALNPHLRKGAVRRSAMLAVDTFSKQSTYNVPIWVYEIVEDDILPVKFEYKAKGYKGLRFSERKQRVVFD